MEGERGGWARWQERHLVARRMKSSLPSLPGSEQPRRAWVPAAEVLPAAVVPAAVVPAEAWLSGSHLL